MYDACVTSGFFILRDDLGDFESCVDRDRDSPAVIGRSFRAALIVFATKYARYKPVMKPGF